ncbi:unnamed protein product, partial [Ectocarpus sp. 8 AP-2014]
GYYGGSQSKQQQQQQQLRQQGARKVQHQAAAAAGAAPTRLAAQGHRHVHEKASRATDSVREAWRVRDGVGNREGGQQRQGRAPAWQQQQQQQRRGDSEADLGGSSPGEGSVSLRKDEAPPGFEPLDTTTS